VPLKPCLPFPSLKPSPGPALHCPAHSRCPPTGRPWPRGASMAHIRSGCTAVRVVPRWFLRLRRSVFPVCFFAYAALSSLLVSSPTPLCLPRWFLRLRRSVFPVGFFAYAALSSPLVSSPTPLISVFPVCFFAYAALSSPLVSSPTPLISVFFQRP
jgi:hypothetical protein